MHIQDAEAVRLALRQLRTTRAEEEQENAANVTGAMTLSFEPSASRLVHLNRYWTKKQKVPHPRTGNAIVDTQVAGARTSR